MQFRSILREAGIDPSLVAVMLHTASEPKLRDHLGALAEEAPDLFEAYQSTHTRQAEATLKARSLAASFISRSGTDMVFAGLYDVVGYEHWTAERLDADPAFAYLRKTYGCTEFCTSGSESDRAGRLRFTLQKRPELSDLTGRLIIGRPAGRGYMRRAENMEAVVVEVLREPHLTPPPPRWQEFVVSAARVNNLPRDWAAKLAAWRGIYLIVDETDGARYVGAAYGDDVNLLGRWRAHVAKEQGVTAELGTRKTENFRFSILETVAPSLDKDSVLRIEASWKERLDTIRFGLNLN